MALFDQPQLAELKTRFETLEVREQQALKYLGIFFAGLFLYFAVLVPASNFRDERATDYERYQALMQYMRATESQARALKGTASGVGGQNLMSDVSNSTRRFGIEPRILQPEGENSVSVWFDGVSFALLLDWLTSVNQQGVTVRQISIDRQDAPGTVSARLVLRG
jgi:type II secretory pathway component PulM